MVIIHTEGISSPLLCLSQLSLQLFSASAEQSSVRPIAAYIRDVIIEIAHISEGALLDTVLEQRICCTLYDNMSMVLDSMPCALLPLF